MPRLLKQQTIYRLKAAQRALELGLADVCKPRPAQYERVPWEGAIPIGLVGTAGELVVAACLYQMLGKKGILRQEDGFYLTAREGLNKLKQLLKNSDSRTNILTEGVEDPTGHLEDIEKAVSPLTVLFTARAGGFHAGVGVRDEVLLASANNVGKVFDVLKKSGRWSPYLEEVVAVPQLPKTYKSIVNDLLGDMESGDTRQTARALTSVFLILPELPENQPEWLDALDRVQIAPKKKDLTILIESLSFAGVGSLYKVGESKNGIPMKIGPQGIPVDITSVKKRFDNALQHWRSCIAEANHKLEEDVLEIPSVQSVYDFFAEGIEELGIPDSEVTEGLSAHELWPFLAASLLYPGTCGPLFFLLSVLKQGEEGQLWSILTKAAKLSPRLQKRIPDYERIISRAANENNSKVIKELEKQAECRRNAREALPDTLDENFPEEATPTTILRNLS